MARKYVRSGKFIKSTLPKRKYVRSGNHSRLKKAEKKLMLEQMREQAKAAKENGLINPMKTIPLATSLKKLNYSTKPNGTVSIRPILVNG